MVLASDAVLSAVVEKRHWRGAVHLSDDLWMCVNVFVCKWIECVWWTGEQKKKKKVLKVGK